MTVVFPLFFVKVAAAGLPPEVARSRLAFASSLSVVLVGLLGPLLGAIADYRGRKKLFLGAFLALGAIATEHMYFIGEGQWAFALGTFVVGNVAVTSTLAFYNSLLPSIAARDEVDRVSTAGFALGYLGGGLLLAVNMAMLGNPRAFGLADTGAAARLSFLSVAAWWVLFSIPLFRHVPEPPRRPEAAETGREARHAAGASETFQRCRHKDGPPPRLPHLQRRRQHDHPHGDDLRGRDSHLSPPPDGRLPDDPARRRALCLRLRDPG
jgi:UMF1 family MFS transporter